MNLANRSANRFVLQPQHGANSPSGSPRVRSASHANRGAPNVPKELRFPAILSHREIDPSILVEIAQCRAALLPVYFHAAFLAGHWLEIPTAVSSQPKPASRVVSRSLRLHVEKILAEKNVLIAIAIGVTRAHGKRRRQLRLDRQRIGSQSDRLDSGTTSNPMCWLQRTASLSRQPRRFPPHRRSRTRDATRTVPARTARPPRQHRAPPTAQLF